MRETTTCPAPAAPATREPTLTAMPGELAVVELALSGVQAGTEVEAELTDVGDDCLCAADRPRRPVEGREEAVARGVELLAAEAGELAPH